MARTDYAPRADYLGNGSLDTYSFDFKIKSLDHLIIGVYSDTFVKTFLVDGNDTTYLDSVTFDAINGGGEIVLADDLPSGHTLYILLADDAPLQEAQFRNKGDFSVAQFEAALDVLSGQIQRLAYLTKRSLRIGDSMVQSEADGFDTEIPFNTTDDADQDNTDCVVCVGDDNASFKMGPSVVTLAAQAAAASASASSASSSASAASTSAAAAANSATAAAASAVTAAAIAAKNTVYNGIVAPDDSIGEDDSFYIDTVAKLMYGPKAGGTWPAPFSLEGPQGIQGNTGTAGAAGLFSSIAAVGSTPNANGVSNVSGAYTAQPADGTNPGVLTAGAQTIGGAKTFAADITANNLSGTNTGDITIGAFGSTPDAKGASLTSQVLTLQPADDTRPGLLSIAAQAIGGVKSFVAHLIRANATGITAFAGGGQGSATALAKDINHVTTVATAGDSVKLPAGVAGMEVVVVNAGASSLDIFPATGEAIDALGANAAYALATSSRNVRFICVTAGVWKSAAAGATLSINAMGAVPNSAGGSVSGGAITLQPADSTNPGLLSAAAQAIGGIKSFIDYIRRSAVSGLTAFAGGGQASATQLAKDINRVTTVATAADSVKLPDALAGSEIVIINKGAASMNVYPKTGEVINSLAANAAYAIPADLNARFICAVNGTWDVAAGSASPLTTKGDIYVRTATGDFRLAVGTDGYRLVADSTQATGLKYEATAPTLFGSTGTPRDVVAATGITSGASHMSTTALVQEIFIKGSVASTICDISANPQIEAGTIVGQEMNIYGESDSAPVQLDDGNGTKLNGTRMIADNSHLCLKWDGLVWREKSYNGV